LGFFWERYVIDKKDKKLPLSKNMEKTLFNSKGEPVAYISGDMKKTIYLWDGHPVAYLYNSYHIYGFNGWHLGWFINGIAYDLDGNRIGFTSTTCPTAAYKEPAKVKKYPTDKLGPRYEAPPLPELGFNYSTEDFEKFLLDGQILP
jgi:hypothetical protein